MKTHLRELSVAVTIGLLSRKIKFDKMDLYNPITFLSHARNIISGDLTSANNIASNHSFTEEFMQIVDNGYKLGNKIFHCSYFHINEYSSICWLGNNTQKSDPIDITVGNYGFSLKEDSFILKNMGLYAFLNSLTGSSFSRGLHVFSTFALDEYDLWFRYSWNKLVEYIRSYRKWELHESTNVSTIKIEADYMIFSYNGFKSKVPISIRTNSDYMRFTKANIREKVFSKWINCELATDSEYVCLKKKCSEKAGRTIADKINSEFRTDNIYDFFRIYSNEYYYAKTTTSDTIILRVPSRRNFNSIIEFKGCRYNIPNSQLNIITKFQNRQTGKFLEFRNECRFSHGQFNGTPEAKMYMERKTPLYELYEPID